MSDIHNHYHLIPEDKDGNWACLGGIICIAAVAIVGLICSYLKAVN